MNHSTRWPLQLCSISKQLYFQTPTLQQWVVLSAISERNRVKNAHVMVNGLNAVRFEPMFESRGPVLTFVARGDARGLPAAMTPEGQMECM